MRSCIFFNNYAIVRPLHIAHRAFAWARRSVVCTARAENDVRVVCAMSFHSCTSFSDSVMLSFTPAPPLLFSPRGMF